MTLTPRQRQVAELVAQGLTYREVGTRLRIGEETVRHTVAQAADRIDLPGSPRHRVVLWWQAEKERRRRAG